MEREIWKPVPGFAGTYEVSSNGNLRRWKSGARTGVAGWKVLRPNLIHGYRYFVLSKGGKAHSMRAARLVLLAFVGEPQTDHEACHCNGLRDDDRVVNLRWDTRTANHADKIAHGTDQRCERHPCARLSEREAGEIYMSDEPQKLIAERFGVSQSTVSAIKTGRLWATADFRRAA